MNVSLTPELERLVSRKLHEGLYTSASEVVREGLRLLRERDEARDARLAALKADIRKGISDIESRRHVSGPGAFEQLRKVRKARKPQRRSA